MKITKGEWLNYLHCQNSGVTNMFDIKVVSEITNMNKDTIIEIMKNYAKYREMYGE